MYILTLIVIALKTSAQAGEHRFGGLDCQFECAEHAAGYVWAERRQILDPNFCPAPAFSDFHEGCLVFTGNPFRGSETTDDALPIKGVAGVFLKDAISFGVKQGRDMKLAAPAWVRSVAKFLTLAKLALCPLVMLRSRLTCKQAALSSRYKNERHDRSRRFFHTLNAVENLSLDIISTIRRLD